MAFDLIAELELLVDALERDRVDYALCGGLALAVHGHPRATQDIDLLVRSEDVARIRALVKTLGFDIPARPMVFGAGTPTAREVDRVSKLDDATGQLLSLDLIRVGAALDPVWSDRVRVKWRAREVVVVSRDGLVTMKKVAGRLQDLADVAALEGTEEET